jgi:hypothetical protein
MSDRYYAPAASVGMANAIEEFFIKRALEGRQQMLDAQNRQKNAADIRQRDEQLRLQKSREEREVAEGQALAAERAKAAEQAASKANNERGVNQMIGDRLMQGPLDVDSARQIAGMGIREGVQVPGIVAQAMTPAKQESFTLGEGQVRFGSDGKVLARGPAKQHEPKQERLVQVMDASGRPIWVRESQAEGQPATQAARAVTGQERKALGFFQRMLEGERNARAVESKIGPQDFAAELAPGETLENFFRSPEGQQYVQAQKTYTEGRLRKESGAAIAKDEYTKDRDINFRRPGDDDKTLKQKRSSRITTLRGAANEAGKALQEFYGPDATIDSLLAEFAEKEAENVADGGGWTEVNGVKIRKKR